MKRSLTAGALAALLVSSPLLAQTRNRGTTPEADAVYKQRSKFSFDFSSPKEGGPVQIQADRQEVVKDGYAILEGSVKIVYQDTTLSADKVTFNQKTKDAEAEGNVILDQGTRRLSAERIIYNLQTKTGTLFNAKGGFEPSVYFVGEKIEKLDEVTYRLTNGVFTSCDIDDPAWSFHLDRGTIRVDDYAYLRNISFRAQKLPLFFAPYLVWPTKRERSQGFLIPSLGVSDTYGTFIGTEYFIPFGDSYDTTIRAEVFSDGYLGLGNQFRYKPSESTEGRLDIYAVRDAEAEETNSEEYKYRYSYVHTQDDLPGGFRGVIDIKDFSDLEFFRKFSRDFEINTISTIYSSAYLTKNRPGYSLNIRTERRENIFGSSTQTFEQTPSIEFRRYPTQIGRTPLYLALESSTSHLSTRGSDYFRADIYPTLSMRLRTPAWFSLKPQVSLRETYYTSSRNPLTGDIVDDGISRSFAQAQVELVGPSFSRVFNRELGGFSKFKHVIEPRARYVYTSDVDNQNEVIPFDLVDSLPFVRDQIEYSLTQRIMGKAAGENASTRELLSFSIRQTATLGDAVQQPGTNVFSRYSPINMTLRANPYQSVTVDATASFGHETRELEQTSLSANLVRNNFEQYLNLRYFANFERPGIPFESSQVQLRVGSPIFKKLVRGDASITYDGERGKFLEQNYRIGYFASCYNITLDYRNLTVPVPAHDYQLSISLTNVGTFVDFRGSFDSLF